MLTRAIARFTSDCGDDFGRVVVWFARDGSGEFQCGRGTLWLENVAPDDLYGSHFTLELAEEGAINIAVYEAHQEEEITLVCFDFIDRHVLTVRSDGM